MNCLEFEVKQEDIESGKCFNPHECAVALALNRCCPGWEDISVSPRRIRFVKGDEVVTVLIKDTALCQFIADFDVNCSRCKPGRLQLFVRSNEDFQRIQKP